MSTKPRFTYSNVVSTLALFLALSGGVAFAASKIQTKDIAKRAVISGKLALGAVRSNQIADGAVSADQIATGAVNAKKIAGGAVGATQIAGGAVGAKQILDGTIGTKQIGASAVAPSNLQFPVFFAASPLGGSAAIPGNQPQPYPLSDAAWTQNPGQLNVIFGGAVGTLAYDEAKGGGSCRVFFAISLNGQQMGGGELSTSSTTPQQVEQTVGVQPEIDPTAPLTNHLSAEIASNEGCTAGSTIDSTRFRVLDFG